MPRVVPAIHALVGGAKEWMHATRAAAKSGYMTTEITSGACAGERRVGTILAAADPLAPSIGKAPREREAQRQKSDGRWVSPKRPR